MTAGRLSPCPPDVLGVHGSLVGDVEDGPLVALGVSLELCPFRLDVMLVLLIVDCRLPSLQRLFPSLLENAFRTLIEFRSGDGLAVMLALRSPLYRLHVPPTSVLSLATWSVRLSLQRLFV